MRLFHRQTLEQERRRAIGKTAILGFVLAGTPVFAFFLDWRLGLVILASYGARVRGLASRAAEMRAVRECERSGVFACERVCAHPTCFSPHIRTVLSQFIPPE